MSAPREPCRRIVVVGDGQVGLLAAIALRSALPLCDVVLIGQHPTPASFADGSPTALPFTNKLHDRLGIEESDIVLRAGGSYRLVTKFAGWAGEVGEGTLSYGETLAPDLKTAFARDWGGGRQIGQSANRRHGSLAEVLADAGRFAPPPPDQLTPLSNIDYALRWNPGAYRALLIEKAQALQVQYLEVNVERVEPGVGGNIAAIEITGQGRIEADLFIDCSGPQATLLASHPDFAMIDWSQSLPTRTVYLGQPTAPEMALCDRVALLEAGWHTRIAGRDGVYEAIGVGEKVDRSAALAALRAPAVAAIGLMPGRAAEPWLGNVIALGDASARFEPLGPYHLDLAHRQIDLLLEMLPGHDIEPLERAEYNRRAVMMMEGVHEVLAFHFASTAAQKIFGRPELPGRMAKVIDQFERRGRIPFREEAPLSSQEQFSLLGALGFDPGLPPAAKAQDIAAEERAKAEFEAAAQAALSFAPPYAQWLSSVSRQAQATAG